MSEADYNAKSLDATLARIEAKLDIYAITQTNQAGGNRGFEKMAVVVSRRLCCYSFSN